jgi:phage terminase large subunit
MNGPPSDQVPSAAEAREITRRCQADPLFFSEHVLGGEHPWARQHEIMLSVRDHARTAVPAGFAVGKTWTAARVALWFLFSFPQSLVISTAPTWRQVETVLWAEIRRQHRLSRMPLGGTVLQTQLRLADEWFALGLSTDEPARFQGFHSEHLLLVFDEASGISREVWDAAEGQMAGAHARWLAIGNPIAPSGPFYDACRSELWRTLPISCLDTPNVRSGRLVYPKLVTAQWVEERRREWGEGSPLFESRVLGTFPESSEHGLIPLSWVLAAHERPASRSAKGKERWVGVDVARSGEDATVFVLREGSSVVEIREHHGLSTMETVGCVVMFVESLQVPWEHVFIDVIGIGAGVVDRLREQGRCARGINFGRRAREARRYANVRAECYWRVREALQPDGAEPLAIPARFGRLAAELTAIEWTVTSAGKILIEPKDDVRARLGRSPDQADALALTFAQRARWYSGAGSGDEDGGEDEDELPWLRIDNEALWTPLGETPYPW